MSQDDFERIQPAQIEISTPAVGRIPQGRHGSPVSATAVAMTVLLLLAVGVVFVLPDIVAERKARDAPPATHAATGNGAPAAAPGTASSAPASPWEEAQSQREREAAKAALDTLLGVQFALQERGVEKWAASEFASATGQARAGDEAYRGGRFSEAEQAYISSAGIMQQLLDGIEQRLGERLAAGLAALLAGDAGQATLLFNEALAIDENNREAQRGLARSGNLGEVMELMQRATSAERAGDEEQALSAYRDALKLDGDWTPAREAIDALQAKRNAARYNTHLSAGFAALADGRADAARKAFDAALAVRPGAAEARDGLQQANFQLSQQRIGELLAKADSAAAAEQWKDAAQHYVAVLAIDKSLSKASEGQRRAETRQALDAALEQLRREPQSLASDTARENTRKLLQGATAIADQGPRLRGQLAEVQSLLARYSTPAPVQLVSDGSTQVTLLRVGKLGSFSSHELELLPGKYIAVGQRNGYRDVRIEFNVRPGEAAQVSVQCQQKI
jgi:hypothetical protein